MKLQATYETDIYIGETGFIVIKQDGPIDESATVFLSPEQAALVCEEMLRLISELKGDQ